VLLELRPLLGRRGPIPVLGRALAALLEVGLVVADEVFLEDGDVAPRGPNIEMAE
jgi:hypothetical protein